VVDGTPGGRISEGHPFPPMANTSITLVNRGQAIRHNGQVCIILELNHRTPPNNRAYVQLKLRSIQTGKVSEERMTPNDSVDLVNTQHETYEYSYADGDGHHFLHPQTFDDIIVPEALVRDIKGYLVENNRYTILFTDGAVAAVELPASMELEVADAPDGVKGDSANNNYKSVTMTTGLVVQAPLFIKTGERLRINTADGKYLSRA
jgi:elongation factor P